MKVTMNGWPVSASFGSIDPAHPVPHNGVDLAINTGTPVPAISDGTVTALTNEGNQSFGQAVHIKMANGDEVVYGHLSAFKAHVGQVVHKGDIIGLSGSTGRSTGPHLHIGVYHNGQAIDPSIYTGGSTGIASLDQWSENFKQDAQGFLENAFGIPQNAFQPSSGDLTQQLANSIAKNLTDAMITAAKEVGIFLLHIAPEILMMGCMISILGMMAGSQRCRHYTSVTAIGMVVAKVVSQCV